MTAIELEKKQDIERIAETLKASSQHTVQRIADVLTGYVMAETNKAEHYDRKECTDDQ